MPRPRALVRRPGPRLAEGIVTHHERRPVDLERARTQWSGYVDAIARAGFDPVEVTPADECPDAVFVEDTLVLYRGLAIVTRPWAASRRPESAAAEAAVRALGYPVERVEAPATLEGGDVLASGDVVFVGTGGRTNLEGARALRRLLAPLGARVVEVPLGPVLHLKSAATALPDGTVVGYLPHLRGADLFANLLAAPEPSGAQVAVLDERRVLVSTDCPRSAELLVGRGLEPIPVEIGEFQKLEGCVTCLSVLSV